MKKYFYPMLIAALMFTAGCDDTFYDVYNSLTGPVESVAIPKTLSVVVNTSEKITANVYPAMTKNKDVTWTSDDPLIAYVDGSGVVTAHIKGGLYLSATITATTVEGGFTAQCVVTVVPVPIPVQSITLPATYSIAKGQQSSLTAVINPSNATSQELTWKSSDPSVAAVDSTGLVTGVTNGTADITVTSVHWSKSATCAITVGDPLFTVTYDSNYSGGPSAVAGGNYKAGDTVTLFNSGTFTRQYYSFTGWNTHSDGSGGSFPASSSSYVMGVQNVTFYAQWTAVSYATSFNGNGNSGGMAPSVISRQGGMVITLPNENTLVYTNFSFKCWNTASDGAGTDYNAGQSYTVTGDTVFYAKWKYDVSHSYTLRSTGPGGGLMFYDKGYYSNGWQYMEAAPVDFANVCWTTTSYEVSGTGTGIGTGKNNTAIIVSFANTSGTAAGLCDSYTNNGKSDWFLPSKDEVNLMFNELVKSSLGSFDTTSASGWYYSSSQTSSWGSAWLISFYWSLMYPAQDMWYGNSGKTTLMKARAARSF